MKNTEALMSILGEPTSGLPNKEFNNYLGQLRKEYDLTGKLSLVHCPTFSFEAFSTDVAKKKGYYAYPPTGLQCLMAALQNADINVDILDLNFKLLERACSASEFEKVHLESMLKDLLDEYFESQHVSIVGVSAGVIVSNIFGVRRHPFIQVLDYLKRRGQQIVITGGVIATNEWKTLLLKELTHFVFRGESENKIIFFLDELLKGKSGRSLSGIYFRANQTFYQTTGERDVVNFQWDLVESYKSIPVERYNTVGSLSPFSRMVGIDKRYGTVQLNRGCRARCTFCGVTPFMGHGVRQRSTSAVVSELKYLVSEQGIQHFEWLDDDLLRHRGALIEVLNKMIGAKLGVTWAANNGLIASSLDQELLRIMTDSGCVGFRIGIESGNDEILRKIRKPATKRTLIRAAKMLEKFPDLFVVGCYIIGFQNETYRQILDTFQFCLEMNLSWSGFSTYQTVRDSTNVTEDFENDSDGHPPSNYEKISDFVPSKANSDGTISGRANRDIREIFEREIDQVHSKENLDEIWFAFNLLANYVDNRNLKPNGRPSQFIQWTQALQLSHPSNAVISLFLHLGYVILGDKSLATEQLRLTRQMLGHSEYWCNRFNQYSLDRVLAEAPANEAQVYKVLNSIRDEYRSLLVPHATPLRDESF